MSEAIGPVVVIAQDGQGPFLPGSSETSEHTQRLVDEEVRRIVETAHEETTEALAAHRANLDALVAELLAQETLDQVDAYAAALDRLGEAAAHVDVLVPGHGAVAEGPEVASRLAADRAYIDALRRGGDPVDARLGPDADWLAGPHRSNVEQARRAATASRE